MQRARTSREMIVIQKTLNAYALKNDVCPGSYLYLESTIGNKFTRGEFEIDGDLSALPLCACCVCRRQPYAPSRPRLFDNATGRSLFGEIPE